MEEVLGNSESARVKKVEPARRDEKTEAEEGILNEIRLACSLRPCNASGRKGESRRKKGDGGGGERAGRSPAYNPSKASPLSSGGGEKKKDPALYVISLDRLREEKKPTVFDAQKK